MIQLKLARQFGMLTVSLLYNGHCAVKVSMRVLPFKTTQRISSDRADRVQRAMDRVMWNEQQFNGGGR
jgi:hypothetical protein